MKVGHGTGSGFGILKYDLPTILSYDLQCNPYGRGHGCILLYRLTCRAVSAVASEACKSEGDDEGCKRSVRNQVVYYRSDEDISYHSDEDISYYSNEGISYHSIEGISCQSNEGMS